MIFLAPLLLIGLVTLPALWWLVRATPPRPRAQEFSSLLVLRRLRPQRQDAAHTPLWLLLLRLVAIALVIVAFSRPVWRPHQDHTIPRNLILILDNGWAAFPHWRDRQQTALALGERTLHAGGHVTLLLSARDPEGRWPAPFTPDDEASLERHLNTLQPQPWPVERQYLKASLQKMALENAHVVVLSDGLSQDDPDAEHEVRDSLSSAQDVEDMRWPRCDLVLLRHDASAHHHIQARVETLPGCPVHSVPLNGLTLNTHGQFDTLARWTLQSNTPKDLTLPEALAGSLDALTIPGAPLPAGMALISGGQHQHPIGLLHLNGDETPLTGSAFYLSRALNSVGTVHDGDITALLSGPLSVLIAPDGTLSSDETMTRALEWVRQGGMLVRFAGNDLANHDDSALTPTERALRTTPLIHGMRQLGGPMSWGSPQGLAPFPATSPFSGLTIPKDVTVSRQVLTQPSDDSQSQVWATLADGTPLVTARHEGRGLIVLFHITPTADWSNLSLSGLFPQMLEQLITNAPTLEQDHPQSTTSSTSWPVWKTLNADGTLQAPLSTTPALPMTASTRVDARHPVGLYGSEAHLHPLNLVAHQPPLQDEPALGRSITSEHVAPERVFWPYLGLVGACMLILDIVLSLKRQGGLSLIKRKRHITSWAIMLLAAGSLGHQAAAAASPAPIPEGALEIRLAHINTGDSDLDQAVQEGLEGLTRFVNQRSTTHLGSPLGVTPGRDDLAFYPLLYWPITPSAQTSPAQDAALNDYMKHGGMLLIDEMGAGSTLDTSGGAATRAALKRVTAKLNIPPLTTINDQHTLSHAFYLLHDYPGRIAGQAVYVARSGNDDGENVSPVMIGNGDWAHAWAIDHDGNPPFAVIPDGDQQRTIAYRFGFNAVIYALTGNYKNDQRHYPEMLHRLKNSSDDTTSSESEDSP